MQSLESIKTKSQESLNRLVDLGKSQPPEVKIWGITGGAAVVGAMTVAALARAVLVIVATVANPPVAVAVGAVAGGIVGWSLMQKPQPAAQRTDEVLAAPDPVAVPDAAASEAPAINAG
jgi:hypothetical protein